VRQFNAPPEWPTPPTPGWRPPRRWRPPSTWPAAPKGWSFWVDAQGRPIRGPIARYGGPSRIRMTALVAVPVVLIAAVAALLLSRPDTGPAVAQHEPEPRSTTVPTPVLVYKNCAAVRAAGKAPLHRGSPGYSRVLDGNGDGVACERGTS
jgi:hypothetical protein